MAATFSVPARQHTQASAYCFYTLQLAPLLQGREDIVLKEAVTVLPGTVQCLEGLCHPAWVPRSPCACPEGFTSLKFSEL